MSDCNPNAPECVVCAQRQIPYREKQVYVLEDVKWFGDVLRFYMPGGATVQGFAWGDGTYHCHANHKLPMGRTVTNVFLSEKYMGDKGISYNRVADTKHPWCLAEDDGSYEQQKLLTRRVEFCLVYGVKDIETPAIVTVPADAKYFDAQLPELRFGIVEGTSLRPEALEEFVLPQYAGATIEDLVKIAPCLIDVRVSFSFGGYEDHARSLFDGNYFHPERPDLIVGESVLLRVHQEYARQMANFTSLAQIAL